MYSNQLANELVLIIGARHRCCVFEVMQENVYTQHTHTFNGPLSRITRVSGYQKRKTNLDFTEARDSQWQWH